MRNTVDCLTVIYKDVANWKNKMTPAAAEWVWNTDGILLQGKPKKLVKMCPSATLSITNPTWTGLVSNPVPVVKNRRVINIINRMRRLWDLRSYGLDSWPMRMRPIGCPETSVRNYHYSLSNSPEERCSHLLRGGSLKSRKMRLRTQFC